VTGSALACSSFWWLARWIWSIRFSWCYHFVESYCQLVLLKKWFLATLLSTVLVTVVMQSVHVLGIRTFFFHCMHVIQVGQHFNLHPNFELWKRRHYPIIPTGMRYIIIGRWQPGHQCESFHWSIIYTVVRGINARCWVICEAKMCEEQWTTGAAGVVIGCEPLKRN